MHVHPPVKNIPNSACQTDKSDLFQELGTPWKNDKILIWYILCSIYYSHEWFWKFRLASRLMYGFKIEVWVASEDVQWKSVSLVTEQYTNGNHHVNMILGSWYIENDWIDLLFIFNIPKCFCSYKLFEGLSTEAGSHRFTARAVFSLIEIFHWCFYQIRWLLLTP